LALNAQAEKLYPTTVVPPVRLEPAQIAAKNGGKSTLVELLLLLWPNYFFFLMLSK
jgi:hypothetical protein